jgi:hypothetical protein
LIFNENVVKYLNLAPLLGGNASSETISTRLLFVYFGLCFVAVGSVLYGIYCPSEVKDYGSANAYVGGDGDSMKWSVMAAIARRLDKSDFRQRFRELRRPQDFENMVEEARPLDERIIELKNASLHMYFDYMNTRHRRVRIACTWVYAAGFACLAVPSLQVFLEVLKLLFSRMGAPVS